MSRRSLITLLFVAAPTVAVASPTSSGSDVYYDFTPDLTHNADERYYDRFAGYYLNDVNQTTPGASNYLAPKVGPGTQPAAAAGDWTATQTQLPGFFMFNFKGATTDVAAPRNDDGAAQSVLQSATVTDSYGNAYDNTLFRQNIRFYSRSFDNYYINTNGSVSFGSAVSSYVPTAFPVSGLPAMIAPFWADLNTANASTNASTKTPGGQIWYRDASRESGTVRAISQFVSAHSAGGLFVPTSVQIVTWDHVDYANPSASYDYQVTTQLVLASDGLQSYAMMLYPKHGTQAITTYASSGAYPVYGFEDGNGNNRNGAGTGTTAMSDLWFGGNTGSGSPGVYLYEIDGTGGAGGSGFLNYSADSAAVTAAQGNSPDGLGGGFSYMGKNVHAAIYSGGKVPIFMRLFSDGYIFHEYQPAASDSALDADGVLAMIRGDSTVANRTQILPTVLPASGTTAVNNGVIAVSRLLLKDSSYTVTVALDTVFGFDYAQTFQSGTLRLANNALVISRVQNAVSGGRVLLTDNSQLWAMQHDSLSSGMTLAFDKSHGGRGGTLDLHGFDTTVGGLDSTSSGAGLITNTTVTFGVAGDLNVPVTTPLLTVSATGSHDYSGNIADGSGFTLALQKTGNGVQRLSGQNTYTGATTVAAGTLLVGGTHASATSVAAGAIFGGSGTISGHVALASGAHLAPGDTAGARLTLTGGVTLADGAVLDLVLGTGATSLRVSGGSLAGPGAGGVVTVTLTPGAGIVPGLYTLIDATGSTITGFDATNLALSGALPGYAASLVDNGSVFAVNLTAVPEPVVYGPVGAGVLAGMAFVRRRRNRP